MSSRTSFLAYGHLTNHLGDRALFDSRITTGNVSVMQALSITAPLQKDKLQRKGGH